MAERFPNPNDSLNRATTTSQGVVDGITNQIPTDLPNPADLIPKIPEIPNFKSLVPKLPLPSFRKPQKIKVENPPLPRKLQKQTKIPKIPKLPQIPDVAGAVGNVASSVQGAVSSATSAVGNITNNLPNL